jgi:hypothetical protein
MSSEISPRDRIVLFAATHGISHNGRFYSISQDYEGGTDPEGCSNGQSVKIASRIGAPSRQGERGTIVIFDTCECRGLYALAH